jgi:hypothetical protein
VYVERSMYVTNERGTATNLITNRVGSLQLTAAEFDKLWALPPGEEPPPVEPVETTQPIDPIEIP